ncbi:MAG: shikimate dehydrogenase [Thiomonas sp.]|uniref:shikimate dehydrogenase n=1 Tax=Thiomonas sp. TaxID=2047785 RepID=UPI002A361C03|nr:shikimate dehydrogenase [Thiomonas sp.]MDY0330855.1 shikimate dehydrogenase [Thiomonas sp.]
MTSTQPPLYAVFGNPIAHSRSPRIHALFAEQTGVALRYEARLAPVDGFEAALDAFHAEGGRGANVTVPFKFDAWRLCARRSAAAQLAQAVNTLGWDEGGLWGDNTDGIGLVRDLARVLGADAHRPLQGQRVLLLGAGGAASGVLGPLLKAGARAIALCNRSADKAQALAARHSALAAQHGADLQVVFEPPAHWADGVINATAASLGGAALDLPEGVLRPGRWAYDMMYGAQDTLFVAQARAAGASAWDGLGMLVEQAAQSYTLWHGEAPDTAPVLAALRAELTASQTS